MKKREKRSFDEHYDQLTKDQLGSIYTCQGFGFLLWFVRTVNSNEKVAILKRNEELLSVNSHGKVSKQIDIQLRDMDVEINDVI